MPKTWRGLPLPEDPRCLLKAPDLKTHLDQEYAGERFFLPREADIERKIGLAMVEAIEDIRDMKYGGDFIVSRYPTGVSVRLPSGWTLQVPFDIPRSPYPTKRGEGKPTIAERPEGNPVATDPEKRSRRRSPAAES